MCRFCGYCSRSKRDRRLVESFRVESFKVESRKVIKINYMKISEENLKATLYIGIGSLIIAIIKFNEDDLTFKSNTKSLIFFGIGVTFFGTHLWIKNKRSKE